MRLTFNLTCPAKLTVPFNFCSIPQRNNEGYSNETKPHMSCFARMMKFFAWRSSQVKLKIPPGTGYFFVGTNSADSLFAVTSESEHLPPFCFLEVCQAFAWPLRKLELDVARPDHSVYGCIWERFFFINIFSTCLNRTNTVL